MITESKLKTGMLILGGSVVGVGAFDFACQATNVRVAPSHNDAGDPVETLCGDSTSPSTQTTWALQGTSIQDFDDAAGFLWYAFDHNLQTVPFSWTPNVDGGSVITGDVQVRALEIGGDVNTRITSDFDWPINGEPTATKPTP